MNALFKTPAPLLEARAAVLRAAVLRPVALRAAVPLVAPPREAVDALFVAEVARFLRLGAASAVFSFKRDFPRADALAEDLGAFFEEETELRLVLRDDEPFFIAIAESPFSQRVTLQYMGRL